MLGRTNIGGSGGGMTINGNLKSVTVSGDKKINAGDFVEYKTQSSSIDVSNDTVKKILNYDDEHTVALFGSNILCILEISNKKREFIYSLSEYKIIDFIIHNKKIIALSKDEENKNLILIFLEFLEGSFKVTLKTTFEDNLLKTYSFENAGKVTIYKNYILLCYVANGGKFKYILCEHLSDNTIKKKSQGVVDFSNIVRGIAYAEAFGEINKVFALTYEGSYYTMSKLAFSDEEFTITFEKKYSLNNDFESSSYIQRYKNFLLINTKNSSNNTICVFNTNTCAFVFSKTCNKNTKLNNIDKNGYFVITEETSGAGNHQIHCYILKYDNITNNIQQTAKFTWRDYRSQHGVMAFVKNTIALKLYEKIFFYNTNIERTVITEYADINNVKTYSGGVAMGIAKDDGEVGEEIQVYVPAT